MLQWRRQSQRNQEIHAVLGDDRYNEQSEAE